MPQIEKLSSAATALVRAEKKRLTQAVRDARLAKEKLPRSQCTAEAKQVGLTYKQATGITFQMLIDHLTLLYQHFGIKHFFIVKELHEDKNIHYHVAIMVQEKPKHMKWADLDFVKPDGLTKTVDYRAVNWKAWISYISKFYKSDPEWSWSHDPFHSLWKEKYQQGGVADRVAMNIMEGESYYVQKLRHSGFSMLNQTKILAFKKRHELGLDQEPQPPPPPLLIRLPVQFQNEHVFMPIGGGFHEIELDGNPVKMFTDTRDYREKQVRDARNVIPNLFTVISNTVLDLGPHTQGQDLSPRPDQKARLPRLQHVLRQRSHALLGRRTLPLCLWR